MVETLILVVLMVAMVALALPVLQVRRDLRVLLDHQERLASQAILVRQEVQALRGHLERLERLGPLETRVMRTADPIPPAIRGQATTPDRDTARAGQKGESK